MIAARIVSDSIANGIRLTTIQTKAPKFLDAEFEKHRMVSSNSSSDRAVPVSRALAAGYFLPGDVRLNQPGMQGDLLLDEDSKEEFWNDLKGLYGYTASILKKWDKVHKQHLNRYLLGFAWQHKVCTATEWDNFFALRLDGAADPAMYELARCMKGAMDGSTPDDLKPGEWHLPYASHEDIRCSVARCARVSYSNHDNSEPDVEKDIELADKLLAAGHMSCFEHQASPMLYTNDYDSGGCIEKGITHTDVSCKYWSGNFKGWVQYRQML